MKFDRLYNILVNHYSDEMIDFIKNNPQEFDNLAELSLSDERIYSWRAAWLIKNCTVPNDERLRKYIDRMIYLLLNTSESQQRELLKILLNMELTEEQEGLLYDKCTILWKAIHKKPAVRYNAMMFLINTSKKYPELINEIKLLTKEHYIETLSPGVKHSLKKQIKKMSALR